MKPQALATLAASENKQRPMVERDDEKKNTEQQM